MALLHLPDGEESQQIEYVFQHDLRGLNQEQAGLFFGRTQHAVFMNELVGRFGDFQGVLGENAGFVGCDSI